MGGGIKLLQDMKCEIVWHEWIEEISADKYSHCRNSIKVAKVSTEKSLR